MPNAAYPKDGVKVNRDECLDILTECWLEEETKEATEVKRQLETENLLLTRHRFDAREEEGEEGFEFEGLAERLPFAETSLRCVTGGGKGITPISSGLVVVWREEKLQRGLYHIHEGKTTSCFFFFCHSLVFFLLI